MGAGARSSLKHGWDGSAGRQPSDRGGGPAAGNRLLQAAQGAEKAAGPRRSAPAGWSGLGRALPGPGRPARAQLGHGSSWQGMAGRAEAHETASRQAVKPPCAAHHLSHAPGSPCAGLDGSPMDRAQAQGGWNGMGARVRDAVEVAQRAHAGRAGRQATPPPTRSAARRRQVRGI